MKAGKITAKLRDAVPFCLMVEGKEVKRYKNIDLPDMLKEVEMLGFHFNVPTDGKITLKSYSYTVVNGEKKCHSAEYITTKSLRRKLASYQTSEGFTRYYYSDELEEYEETKLHRFDWTVDGTDTPCESETIRSFPYDHQTYILNWDGSMYNEICEFAFDDEKTGHGYYYQANRKAYVV